MQNDMESITPLECILPLGKKLFSDFADELNKKNDPNNEEKKIAEEWQKEAVEHLKKMRNIPTCFETMNDPVNHPSHYCLANGAELIDIIDGLAYCRAAAIKYIFRAGVKNPDTECEDLRKAIWMIRRELERIGWKDESNT